MATVTLTNTNQRTLTIDVDGTAFVVNKTTADINLGATVDVDADSVYVYWWNIGRSRSPQLIAINYADCTSPTFANVTELYDWLIDACNGVGLDLSEESGRFKVTGINGFDCTEVVPSGHNQTLRTDSDGAGGWKWVIS